jgi:hypothetical protein
VFRDTWSGGVPYVVAKGRPLRQVQASDVTFELDVDPDESDPADSLASGPADDDPTLVPGILARLEAGDHTAWCGVGVTATWISGTGERIRAGDSVWGCSLDDEYTAEVCAREHGLYENAVAQLNEDIADAVERAERLALELRPGRGQL